MKHLIPVVFLVVLTAASYSQWTSNYGGLNNTDVNLLNAKGFALAFDNADNCYVTGYCNDGTSGNDILIIKYDANGDTTWTRSYNGSDNSDDAGYGVIVDGSGNIYVAGTSSNSGTSNDLTLLKYDSTGELIWADNYSVFNGNGEDKGLDIKLDHNGNIFVTGYGTTENGNSIIVTKKYSTNGSNLWTNLVNDSTGNSKGVAMEIDHSGNVCVTGYIPSNNSSDIILIKYDSQGNYVFRRDMGGPGEDRAWGIAVDDEDHIFITGYYSIAENNTDCYIAKYDSSGNLEWSQLYNGPGNSLDKAWGIAVDEEDGAYITGSTTDAANNVNYITLKYSLSGEELWAASYNGTGGGTDVANAIGLSYRNGSVEKVIVAGESWGTNNNYDFATVSYDPQNGSEISVSRYSLNEVSDDKAQDIAVSPSNGRIYITGYSEILISGRLSGTSGSSFVSSIMYPLSQGSQNTENNTPQGFSLRQNYPNPFNPSTSIQFSIPVDANVKLRVYDILGKEVGILIDNELKAGFYSVNYSNQNLSSGVYFYELRAGKYRDIKKMTLLK